MRKKFKIYAIYILILLINIYAKGQTINVYDQYYLHNELANPAFTGLELFPIFNFSYKKQWISIPNSPSVQILSYSQRFDVYDFYTPKSYLNKSRIKSKGRTGLGALMYSNTEGPLATIGSHFKYAYHLPLNKAKLSFGGSISLNQSSLKQWQFEPSDPNDPILNYKVDKIFYSGIDAGILYSTDELFAGISFPEFLKLGSNLPNRFETEKTNFIITSGYLYIINKTYSFEPAIFVYRNALTEIEWELYSKLYLKEHWFSLAFNYKNNVKGYVSFKFNKLYFGYCYTYLLSKISTFKPGNHQFFIGLNIGVKRDEKEGENFISIFK